MSRDEIVQAIRSFIQTNFMVEEFVDNESFLESGIIDSLGVIDLMAFIEKEYEIKVDPTDVTPENFDSVDRLANFVCAQRQAAQASR